MTNKKLEIKKLHKRNVHNNRYEFITLIKSYPSLEEYVIKNKYDDLSIDFSNAKAVLCLNKALLSHFYNIKNYDLPKENLCPPIPGRADYLHYMADLLADINKGKIPLGKDIKVLDIGTGANCIYALLGSSIYKWSFKASDISITSLETASNIILSNENIKDSISLLEQKNKNFIFKDIIKENDYFSFTLCNPPFHKSKKDALEGSSKKVKNLSKNKNAKTKLNFSGLAHELWCDGGEISFINKMIKESFEYKNNCLYFSTLISKGENLKIFYKSLKEINAKEFNIIEMTQGQKITRILYWTFLDKKEQKLWAKNKFSQNIQ